MSRSCMHLEGQCRKGQRCNPNLRVIPSFDKAQSARIHSGFELSRLLVDIRFRDIAVYARVGEGWIALLRVRSGARARTGRLFRRAARPCAGAAVITPLCPAYLLVIVRKRDVPKQGHLHSGPRWIDFKLTRTGRQDHNCFSARCVLASDPEPTSPAW